MEKKDKPTILLVSDLVIPTGFSRVTHSTFSHLLDKYQLVGLGVNYHGDPHDNPIPVFPASAVNKKDVYGYGRIMSIVDRYKPDIIWILNDPWSIDGYLEVIKAGFDDKNRTYPMPKLLAYFPVDSIYHDKDWYRNFDMLYTSATYTNFGADVVQEADSDISPTVIPHGTESSVFYPKDKDESKEEVYGSQPWEKKDSFIVLNANRNQPRKRLDLSLQGFAMFAKDKPDNVKIHMHCGVVDSAFDVIKLARRYGVEERLILTNLNPGPQTVPDDKLNTIYNAADVGINTSMGEGWGLTNTEHAVTRTAQIIPNHSACAELFNDCGLLIDAPIPYTFDNTQTQGYLVSPGSLADHLQTLYDDKKLRNELAEKAYKKFTHPRYSWKTVADLWDVIFEGALDDSNIELANEHTGDDSRDNK